MLDLILKDIQDTWARENFFRLRKFLGEQVLFDANFKLFDITVNKKDANFKVKHGLTFIPSDIIFLSCYGDYNFAFLYQDIDRENIYINAHGPVRIRFLAGRLNDQLGSGATTLNPPFVPPGGLVGPSGPGFVFGAVGAKTTGFWMTSEDIPTNVVGIPVLFGDAAVIQAAVGSEAEASYTIGIYQHEGAGVNITQIGQFTIISGGVKRVAFDFPITYSSPNVQLACRILSGDTLNLKVSLILRGSTV